MKKWIIEKPDPGIVSALQRGSDLSWLCCQVLAAQGIENLQQAGERIGCQALSDPFLICDMREAAQALTDAMDDGRHICVYGDYDCDGVMATVILYSYLQQMGANVSWRIPERADGYGLSCKAVEEMHEAGVELIVTVDNGIAAIPEAQRIRELGMELIVTDHHQPGDRLPEAIAVVDPHREDNYSPFRLYCGAGIALLLVAALNDGDTEMALEQFGDLAAVATIADIVSLTGENRYLVQMGLQYLENSENPGLRALREVSGLGGKELTSVNVAFSIAPRINAAGRMRSASLAASLLLEEDPARARELAGELGNINNERKTCEAQIVQEALSQLAADPSLLYQRILVFAGENWHDGVIGIVAAKLQERFGKPCFVISLHDDGTGHGSARSFGDVSVYKALRACEQHLEKYGGHPGAGGFTLKKGALDAFRRTLLEWAGRVHPEMPVMEIRAACVLEPMQITVEAASSLSQLEPFGADQPEPVFLIENAVIRELRPLSGGIHTKLIVLVGDLVYEALMFGTAPERVGFVPGDVCHMLVRLNVNTYHGMSRVDLMVKDLRSSGLKQGKILSAVRTYDSYRRGEPLPQTYYRAMYPDRAALTAVYRAVPEKGIRMERLIQQMYTQDINYCKMRIALDALSELGLVRLSVTGTEAVRLPVGQRADLGTSRVLRELRQQAGLEEGEIV